MKNISKQDAVWRSIGGIVSIVIAVYLNWLFTPAWTFKSQGFWWYWIVVIAEFTLIQFLVEKKNGDWEHKVSKKIGIGCLGVTLLTMLLMFFSSELMHAREYSNLVQVEDGNFATDIPQVCEDSKMITLDMQTAQQLGSRVIGSLPNISRYSVNEEYNLTKYNGEYYRVTPLEYADGWKALTNSSEGLPAYVVVNATENKADILNLEKNIRYSPNAFGSYNLKRHLRNEYKTYIFGDFQFEIDDKNNPYYIVPVMEANIGLFGGKTVSSFLVVDAVNGKSEEYLPEELPPWVNHAYSLSNLMGLASYHYGYKNGFWNYVIFENDILKLSYNYKDNSEEDEEADESIDNFDGYSSILINGEINFLTGLVSTGEDESMVGFITANPRTGKIKFYNCVGAEEGTAQKSAESLVQNFGYSASYPIVVNVEGQETYFMTLKDKTLNNKAFAFVNVREYNKAVQSENFDEALKLYKQKIAIDTKNASEEKEETLKEGKIVELYQAIKSGNTNYFFRLEGDEMLYVSSIEINSKQVKMKIGDTVEVTYSSAEEEGVGIIKRITIK